MYFEKIFKGIKSFKIEYVIEDIKYVDYLKKKKSNIYIEEGVIKENSYRGELIKWKYIDMYENKKYNLLFYMLFKIFKVWENILLFYY